MLRQSTLWKSGGVIFSYNARGQRRAKRVRWTALFDGLR